MQTGLPLVCLAAVAAAADMQEVELTWLPVPSRDYCLSLPRSNVLYSNGFGRPGVTPPAASPDGLLCTRLVGKAQSLSPYENVDIAFGRLKGGEVNGCDRANSAACNGTYTLNFPPAPSPFVLSFLWRAGDVSEAFRFGAPVGIINAAFSMENPQCSSGTEALNLKIGADGACELFAEEEFIATEGGISFSPEGVMRAHVEVTTQRSGVSTSVNYIGVKCTVPRNAATLKVLETCGGDFTYEFNDGLQKLRAAFESGKPADDVQKDLPLQNGVLQSYVWQLPKYTRHITLESSDFCRSKTRAECTEQPCAWSLMKDWCEMVAAPTFNPPSGELPYKADTVIKFEMLSWGPTYQSTSRIYYSVSNSTVNPITLDPTQLGKPGGPLLCLSQACEVIIEPGVTYYIQAQAYMVANEGLRMYSAVGHASYTFAPEVPAEEPGAQKMGPIIGAIVGVLFLIALLGLLWWWRRAKGAGDDGEDEDGNGEELEGGAFQEMQDDRAHVTYTNNQGPADEDLLM